MDPVANLNEQREIAARFMQAADGDHDAVDPIADGVRLAELVEALDLWRRKGGFDPYLQADDPEPQKVIYNAAGGVTHNPEWSAWANRVGARLEAMSDDDLQAFAARHKPTARGSLAGLIDAEAERRLGEVEWGEYRGSTAAWREGVGLPAKEALDAAREYVGPTGDLNGQRRAEVADLLAENGLQDAVAAFRHGRGFKPRRLIIVRPDLSMAELDAPVEKERGRR